VPAASAEASVAADRQHQLVEAYEGLDEPLGVRVFRTVGAEPTLTVFDVAATINL
jgi:hypothetical protein